MVEIVKYIVDQINMAKILYFEDNRDYRDIVVECLRDSKIVDIEIDAYSDPTKFLTNLESSLPEYDLLITDVRMPHMDGTTFVKNHIVAKGLKIPFLFLASADEEDIRKAGITNFELLLKGAIPLSDLENKIKEMLSKN